MSEVPTPTASAVTVQPMSRQHNYTLKPIGEDPDDLIQPKGALAAVEALLRHPRRLLFQLKQGKAAPLLVALLGATVVLGLIYGVIVGSFSGGVQLWAAPLKVVFGMISTAVICLPSLYIFACLSGSHAKISDVIGLMVGLLAMIALLLIGFAPVAWIFARSINSLAGMGFLHLMFWFVAAGFGLRFLANGFGHLGIRSNAGIAVWILIFVLVSLQMSTALRPLIGTSPELLTSEKKFFAQHWADSLGGGSKPKPTPPADQYAPR
jgi:hypothetical protein